MAFQEWVQNPWTQFGAALAAGFDPQRQGLGGLGAAILGTGQQMREQQRYETEQARARQLADLQMQTFQAELAATQRKQQQRERLAEIYADPNLSEEQKVLAVQEVMPLTAAQAQIESLYKAPAAWQQKVNWALENPEAAAEASRLGVFGGVNIMTPPPGIPGYQVVPTPGGGYGYQPVKGAPPSKEELKIQREGDIAKRRIGRMRELLDEYGTEPLPFGGRSKMTSVLQSLLVTMKEMAGLGVLQGADIDLVMQMIGDPTEITAGVKGVDFYKSKLDEAEQYVQDRIDVFLGKKAPSGVETRTTATGVPYTVKGD